MFQIGPHLHEDVRSPLLASEALFALVPS